MTKKRCPSRKMFDRGFSSQGNFKTYPGMFNPLGRSWGQYNYGGGGLREIARTVPQVSSAERKERHAPIELTIHVQYISLLVWSVRSGASALPTSPSGKGSFRLRKPRRRLTNGTRLIARGTVTLQEFCILPGLGGLVEYAAVRPARVLEGVLFLAPD
jgi:hypothetical protein